MDITAEKYYDDNFENYTLLNKIDPITAKQVIKMMEEYHQAKLKLLGIADVVDSENRTELPEYTIPEFGTDEWIDCCEQLFGGMRKSR